MKHTSTLVLASILATTITTTARADDATRSESVAIAVPVAAEVASVVMLASPTKGVQYAGVAGLAIAPSLGHWYAGHYVSRGMLLRAAGLAVIGSSFLERRATSCGADGCQTAEPLGAQTVGALLVIAGSIDDFATTPRAVRRYNARFQMTPVASPQLTGLAVAGRF